jgi:hypothetical protein
LLAGLVDDATGMMVFGKVLIRMLAFALRAVARYAVEAPDDHFMQGY